MERFGIPAIQSELSGSFHPPPTEFPHAQFHEFPRHRNSTTFSTRSTSSFHFWHPHGQPFSEQPPHPQPRTSAFFTPTISFHTGTCAEPELKPHIATAKPKPFQHILPNQSFHPSPPEQKKIKNNKRSRRTAQRGLKRMRSNKIRKGNIQSKQWLHHIKQRCITDFGLLADPKSTLQHNFNQALTNVTFKTQLPTANQPILP